MRVATTADAIARQEWYIVAECSSDGILSFDGPSLASTEAKAFDELMSTP